MSKKVQNTNGVDKYRSPQCIAFHITLESSVLTDSYSASREQIGGLNDFPDSDWIDLSLL